MSAERKAAVGRPEMTSLVGAARVRVKCDGLRPQDMVAFGNGSR